MIGDINAKRSRNTRGRERTDPEEAQVHRGLENVAPWRSSALRLPLNLVNVSAGFDGGPWQ